MYFALVKREVLSTLKYPFFKVEDGRYCTDGYFCGKVREAGFDIIASYNYCLNHRDITQDNVVHKRISDGLKFKRRKDEFVARDTAVCR
jgi:hypothetical protein